MIFKRFVRLAVADSRLKSTPKELALYVQCWIKYKGCSQDLFRGTHNFLHVYYSRFSLPINHVASLETHLRV